MHDSTAEALARTHADGFADGTRPWSAQEIKSLLDGPGVFIAGDARGFVIGRAVAGEAEILTLVTAPAERRKGHARRLLAAFEAEARARDAAEAFLEVAADNMAAIRLYERGGYLIRNRRPGYYDRADGPAEDALIMGKSLNHAGE